MVVWCAPEFVIVCVCVVTKSSAFCFRKQSSLSLERAAHFHRMHQQDALPMCFHVLIHRAAAVGGGGIGVAVFFGYITIWHCRCFSVTLS